MPYLHNALSFTLETVVGLYLTVVILRLLLQLLRADFYNPISRFIVAATHPPLTLLRRFIPDMRLGLSGIDLSTVLLILIVGIIKTTLLLTLSGYGFNLFGVLLLSLADVLNSIIWILIIIILGSAILSWVAPLSQHPTIRLINNMSNPLLAPFRKILPYIQGIDLSPLLALLLLNLIKSLVIHPVSDLGRSFLF